MGKITSGIKKEYLIAAGILFLVLTVSFYMFVAAPSFRKMAQLAQKEAALLAQIRTADSVVFNKTVLSEEIGGITRKVEYLEKLLPRNVEMSQILMELAQRGRENNITIASLEPQKINRVKTGREDEFCLEIPIKLSIKAGFHEFARFIQGIETSERFMKAEDISIRADKTDELRHNISLILIAFALEG